MYFDAHTHLNSEQLYPDRQTHLETFVQAGGIGLINIGVNDDRNKKAISIAAQAQQLYPEDRLFCKATIGVHPGEVSFGHIINDVDISSQIEKLKRLYDEHSSHIVAIGECGIDAHYDGYAQIKSVQQELFHQQALLARERQLPVVIHTRDQFDDTWEVIKEFPDLSIYFHCRGYTPENVTTVASLPQTRIGFCGNTSYPKAQQLRDSLHAARALQEKDASIRIVLETDAPYLSPQKKRGTTNCPLHLIDLYEFVSLELDIPLSTLQKSLYENNKKLYM